MRTAIISLGSKSTVMLAEAMEKYFTTVDMLDLRNIEVNLSKEMEVLYEGKDPLSAVKELMTREAKEEDYK